MNEDLYLIRKVDANFVKEAFLKIFLKNKEDVNSMIKNYKVLGVLTEEKEWVEQYVAGI